ncbi:hypothetical protein [Bifidobacterium leontopitheci]|nr:hypothetical protein [Bifidobacterium leontopitheci]
MTQGSFQRHRSFCIPQHRDIGRIHVNVNVNRVNVNHVTLLALAS